MSERQLKEQLANLRALVNEIGAQKPESLKPESLARLNRLVSDIEERIEGGGGTRPDLADTVRDAIRHFEVEHPRATAVLNDIMVTLGNMGI